MSRMLLLLIAGLAATASVSHAEEAVSEADLAEARGLVKGFMTDLKGELTGAIDEGGPANAIGVCAKQAPGIATALSERSGWAVGRTALRVRNPRNAPSPQERAVLLTFQARATAGEDLATMEYAAIEGEGEGRFLHYMKAIPTAELCTNCHGTAVKPDLLRTIQETYPQDAATGFEIGQLRGAFTFVKPIGGE